MWVFPIAAAIVSGVFAALTAQQFISRHRAHQLAWSIALLMFAGASFAAGLGMVGGWSESLFRVYYLLGAILNVPVLGLGSIYLLAPRRAGHVAAVIVVGASIFAIGVVMNADLVSSELPASGEIASGASVLADEPFVRLLSRYFSFTGFLVVVAGALWSAWRLAMKREESLRRLAAGNVLIAAGTALVAVASMLARVGRGAIFSIGLLIGVTVMFWGFLKTRMPALQAEPDSPAAAAEHAGSTQADS